MTDKKSNPNSKKSRSSSKWSLTPFQTVFGNKHAGPLAVEIPGLGLYVLLLCVCMILLECLCSWFLDEVKGHPATELYTIILDNNLAQYSYLAEHSSSCI